MSKIYLPSGHPAIQILRDEGIEALDSALLEQEQQSGLPPLRIALINLMPNPDHPVADFGRLLAQYPNRDIEILDFSPTPTNISADKDTIAKRSTLLPLNTLPGHDIDAAIVSGFGKEDLNFKALRFWPELTPALDHLQRNKVPTLASCWGAQAALYHHHGIEKTWDVADKILGVFDQEITNPNHPLLAGLDAEFSFPMPVSRIGRCDENQILAKEQQGALSVLATNEDTGASIVVAGHVTCVTGHFEYNQYSLPEEHERDISRNAAHLNGNPEKYVPVNVYVDDDRTKAVLPAQWHAPGQIIMNNWTKSADHYSRNLKPQITAAKEPTAAMSIAGLRTTALTA